MNNFTFAIVLNYAERTFSLKSPFSLNSLIEIALDKFELTKLNYLSYFDADDDEIKLSNDHDYLNLFDYVESNGLKEINVFLKSNESKCKKSTYKFNTITFLPSNEYQCVNGKLSF